MKYALLGCYDNQSHQNIEVLATSDSIGELSGIKILVNMANEIGAFGYGEDMDEKQKKVAEEMDDVVPVFDEGAGYYEQVEVTGIYELKEVEECPKQLPKAKINDKTYYRDDRLQEYRNVDNPHDRISFKEIEVRSE